MTTPPDGNRLAGTTVCFVSPADFSGWTRTYKQARTLRAAGARVVFVGLDQFLGRRDVDSAFETVRVRPPKPPSFHSSNSRFRFTRVLMNRTINRFLNRVANPRLGASLQTRTYHRLVRAVVRTNADVIQAVDLPALRGAREAALKMRARLVYDCHELWAGLLENPAFSREDPGLAEGLLSAESAIAPEADVLLVTSDLMGERLTDMYGIRSPLTILNTPPARVEEARPVHVPVRLVFHGGINPDRNVDGLIRAVGQLRGLATLDIHGFGVGTSQSAGDEVVRDLQRLIETLDLGEVVRMHGPFNYDDVVDLLGDYDLGVMAAKVIEDNFAVTLPNKVFDCMCAGLAVAMYDSPAVRTVLADVPFGICLDPSSPETIASDLQPLLQYPQRIARMKHAAVEASSRYWWPQQERKLVNAYAAILGRD